jgi:hypothetical protein
MSASSDAVSEAFAQAIARGSAIDDVDRWVWRSAFSIARGDPKRRNMQTSDVPDRELALGRDGPFETGELLHHHQ